MHAYPLLLFLISCILSESFQTPSFRLRAVTGFLKLKATDDSTTATESTLTIAEKEREFQITLDKLLAEARANNASSGKLEGEDFTDEEIAKASAELKQLKFLNSKEELAKVAINAKKQSWEDDESVKAAPAAAAGLAIKQLAIFGALTIVFASILLPIIDKIFPDPPSIESSITAK